MNRALIGHSRDRENVQTPWSAREAWWGAGGRGGGERGEGRGEREGEGQGRCFIWDSWSPDPHII